MTMEQRKISLINWITNLQDESVINKIEGFRSTYFHDLPKEIVELLEMSDAENPKECIEHTNSRDIIGK